MSEFSESFKANGASAVMAERRDPTDALDFFPTPPWATRALMEHVLTPDDFEGCDAWDACAGEGHMVGVLGEYFAKVHASDVHDYGKGYGVGSFVGAGLDLARLATQPDWLVMNPPFNLGIEFALRAMQEARVGVAMLMRSVWPEGKRRYREIFSRPERSPVLMAQFSERVPMHKGRWVVNGSTATSYSWFVWRRHGGNQPRQHVMIPPECRRRLMRPDDVARFGGVYETKKRKAKAA
jgi:predicted RNA methylase